MAKPIWRVNIVLPDLIETLYIRDFVAIHSFSQIQYGAFNMAD